MKVLVLQLARFGDIYQTWPALRAFKRTYPSAEIHFMVRERFVAATEGLDAVDRVIPLETKSFIEDLIQTGAEEATSLVKAQSFLQQIKNEKYDQVYNLSYSRLAAYLTSFLQADGSQACGYALHSDGMMFPLDGTSSYFMAQVGVGKFNRFHLTDIFANQMNLEFIADDFNYTGAQPAVPGFQSAHVAVHVGASEAGKTLSATKWSNLVKALFAHGIRNVALIGSTAEIEIAQKIENSVSGGVIQNLVGKTRLAQVFTVLRSTELLIAGDSSIMQIASLVNCRTLNISTSQVSFWETGPRADHSKVYSCMDPEMLDAEEVSRMASSMLSAKSSNLEQNLLQGTASRPEFMGPQTSALEDFCWQMISAIYLSENFPVLQNMDDYRAMGHLNEMNELSIKHIEAMQATASSEAISKHAEVLAQVDIAFAKLAKVSPCTSILWNWLQVERVKIPPIAMSEVFNQTKNLHLELRDVLKLYVLDQQAEAKHG